MSQADGRKCRPRGVFVNHLRNPQKQKPLFQRFCIFHPPWNTKKHLMFSVPGPTILKCIEQTDVIETWMMWPWQMNTLSILMFMLKLGQMIKAEAWSILRSWNLYFEAESWLWFWIWWFYIISIGWWNLRIPQKQRALLTSICINQPSTNSKKEKALYRRFHICHPPVFITPQKTHF